MRNTFFDKARLINFSDAVFSIAMTLLILELAIPDSMDIYEKGTMAVLENMIPNFIGLIVSFFVIALYWVSHVRLLKYLPDEFDNGFVWLNLLMLLTIVMLPFSTGFYVEGFRVNGPFVFYCINIIVLGFFHFLMKIKVFKLKGDLSEDEKVIYGWEKAKALNALFVWVLAAVVSFIWPGVARYLFCLIFVFEIFINRYYKKKNSYC